ncbi:molybdopterin-dependent oxidoreductase [Planotetraspora sp. A-T 1434]|uniref:molybdopterin-dependent oxidoreductase n=1 Tax=Planotetraspora sp. A-T 1434 TaxID=2979219 RepID=UPI0021C096AC|nr:molybdopterin-dependent oxidoreductase [Planotetraspora sp. A-T 1434]MCT9935113.1 molybdopterin-dependent oxidoreductase [Planotetraspora sp. A-T 1434]
MNFTSRLHDERTASWLGIWLGVSFTVTFITGLISHFLQAPPDWMLWPSQPVNLYRFTQGLHVIGGLATLPLLLAKMWTVYPKLWQRPVVRSAAHALERGFVFLLVAGSLFQLVTGLFNISYWYPFPFFFTAAHYSTAYIVYGALLVHVANEWAKVRRALDPPTAHDASQSGPSRRGFLTAVAAASGVVALTTVGETYAPLASLAVLAPRRPRVGPQRLPVNRSARAARVILPADYRLTVSGAVRRPLALSLTDLAALSQHTSALPITCVEGWSADATWTGVRLHDLLQLAGADDDARLRVESLQTRGGYGTSMVGPPHWQDPLTLLALRLNGETLHLDHGYPCRLIAPNRPGVLQTKWVTRVVVL